MREIKCRGLAKESGKFVYGVLIVMQHTDKRHFHYFIIPECSDMSYGTLLESILVEVIPETVGQYTGLPDKNGKEIYEGDTVKNTGYDELCVIEQHKGDYIMRYGEKSYCNLGFYVCERNSVEVIGNIHEGQQS